MDRTVRRQGGPPGSAVLFLVCFRNPSRRPPVTPRAVSCTATARGWTVYVLGGVAPASQTLHVPTEGRQQKIVGNSEAVTSRRFALGIARFGAPIGMSVSGKGPSALERRASSGHHRKSVLWFSQQPPDENACGPRGLSVLNDVPWVVAPWRCTSDLRQQASAVAGACAV